MCSKRQETVSNISSSNSRSRTVGAGCRNSSKKRWGISCSLYFSRSFLFDLVMFCVSLFCLLLRPSRIKPLSSLVEALRHLLRLRSCVPKASRVCLSLSCVSMSLSVSCLLCLSFSLCLLCLLTRLALPCCTRGSFWCCPWPSLQQQSQRFAAAAVAGFRAPCGDQQGGAAAVRQNYAEQEYQMRTQKSSVPTPSI